MKKDNKKRSPKIGEKILRYVSNKNESESFSGDVEELYFDVRAQKGKSYAYLWYWIQILKSVWNNIDISFYWGKELSKNYIKIAIRYIRNQKFYSFINICGLALGMACTVLIYLWIQNELSYDRYHEKADRIYRVISDYDGYKVPTTPGPFAGFLKYQIPEVVNATRFKTTGGLFNYNKHSYRLKGLLIDKEFLEIFTFPEIEGDPQSSLSRLGSIILTEKTAAKFFSKSAMSGSYEDVIGKTLTVENQFSDEVTSVIEDVPDNTSPPFKFDFLYTFELIRRWRQPDNWADGSDYHTFVLLTKNASLDRVNNKIDAILRRYNFDNKQKYYLQPLTRIHLYSDCQRWDGPHGDIEYVMIFTLVAFFIMVIACINYMNLSTARSMARAKEVGMRKVLGAHRRQLMRQFFSESVLFTCLALPVSILLIEMFMPVFKELSGKQLSFSYTDGRMVLSIIGLVVFTGVVSGIYPALFLSSFQPVKVLRGQPFFVRFSLKKKRVSFKHISFRNILVVIQFALSIVIIICTVIVYNQLTFMRNKKLGFEKENLLYVPVTGGTGGETAFNSIKNELIKLPGVVNVSGSNQIPTSSEWVPAVKIHYNGNERIVGFPSFSVDHDYLNTLKMEISRGRFFQKEFSSDREKAFIINESALKELDMDEPLGKKMDMPGLKKKGEIIGVVKDFHFETMHKEIQPLIMVMEKEYSYLNIRIKPDGISETINNIEKLVKTHYPGIPFEFHFLNETIDQLYKTELRLEQLFIYFSIIAVFISCLGLYGLASFIAEKRTKEISVRKVLGASVPGMVSFLMKDFTKWIFYANLIAWPAAWFYTKKWLLNFAYRTNVNLLTFVFVAFLTLFIALLTVCVQAVKAARTNPVNTLKCE